MNALDMISGFTASAGPIGGAETGNVNSDGAVTIGGFDALVARALGGQSDDVDVSDAETSDADADATTDLSLLLAMAGVSIAPFTPAPVVVDLPPATIAGEGSSTGDSIDAVSGGVGMTVDTLPCTLVPAGADTPLADDSASESQGAGSAFNSVLGFTPVEASQTPVTGTAGAVESPVPPVVAAAEPVAEAAATQSKMTPSLQETTNLVPAVQAAAQSGVQPAASDAAVATPTVSTAAPIESASLETGSSTQPAAATSPDGQSIAPTSDATLTATPHTETTLRAALGRAARQARAAAAAAEIDPAKSQAVSELRAAIESTRTTSDSASASNASSTTAPVSGPARQTEQPRAQNRTSQSASSADTFTGMTSAFVAASAGAGNSGDTGTRDGGDFRGRAFAGIDGVSAGHAKTEGAAQVFSLASSLSGAVTPIQTEAVGGEVETAAVQITPQDHTQNLHSVVRSVRMHFHDGGGEARLQLNPEHLGQVTLTVKVEQGSVAAHIRAETADAQRWIESNQQELRSALEEQGLDVKELVVTTDPEGRREREQPRDGSRPRTRRRETDASVPKFEVIV